EGLVLAVEKLRFDFNHFKNIDEGQLKRIEALVNGFILDNQSLSVKETTLALAKKTKALAFFGEKYGSKVRVVQVPGVSAELCGGTHLKATGQIGLFKILQESSIAQGVRRIEAVTGLAAYEAIKQEESVVVQLSQLLRAPYSTLVQEVEKRLLRIKELEKQLHAQKFDTVKSSLDVFIQEAEKINTVSFIGRSLPDADMQVLRKNVDLIKQKTQRAIIMLCSAQQGKAFLVMGITEDLVQEGFDAAQLIIEPAQSIGGSGGGRKDFAQAGGMQPENLNRAIDILREAVAKRV
ncbi:MAG: alanine--tRNA ligase, partial [Candidatus Omnitrophica bacterium]|nr:alanine--tRNA ligase [Candidatus Omnitrophota bacterium]